MDTEILRYAAIGFIVLMVVWYINRYFRIDRKLPGKKVEELLLHFNSVNLDGVTMTEDEPFDKWTLVKGARPIARVRISGSIFEYLEIMVLGRRVDENNFLLDYSFPAPGLDIRTRTKETCYKYNKKRGHYWSGDSALANILNKDTVLGERLVSSGISEKYISIVPEPLLERGRIRMIYYLPCTEHFQLLEDIANNFRAYFQIFRD